MKKTTYSILTFILLLITISCSSSENSIDSGILDIVNNLETPENEIPVEEDKELDPLLAPGKNFDLSKWNLGIPIAESDGTSSDITTTQLVNGYENSTYFYTNSVDGAMVFKNFIAGPTTSSGTKYTRTELREMIYGTLYDLGGRSTKDLANNWNFSFFDNDLTNGAGGIDGELTATVAINHVTTTTGTGDNKEDGQIGRVVIGQIHAKNDEPCRLYYRKLANNTKGSIYFAHEPVVGSEQWHELIGTRSSSLSNPEDGIALNEKFSYSIKVKGVNLTVTISREDKPDVSKVIDMTNSGYGDVDGQYMYFKAGVYTQNNTGNDTDYDQVSFYDLNVTH